MDLGPTNDLAPAPPTGDLTAFSGCARSSPAGTRAQYRASGVFAWYSWIFSGRQQ